MAQAADPELFRKVFGRFATGVAVVTTETGGMTANALCSLSLDPLLALVCFQNDARTLHAVRDAQAFAVNVLTSGQRQVAAAFASKMPEHEKLAQVAHRVVRGMPVIEGTLAWAVLELRELLAGGDHTIAIGEVVELGLGEGEPLLWFEGSYQALR